MNEDGLFLIGLTIIISLGIISLAVVCIMTKREEEKTRRIIGDRDQEDD